MDRSEVRVKYVLMLKVKIKFSEGLLECVFSSSFGPLLLDLGVGVEGSSGDVRKVLFLGAVVGVGAGLDLLAQLLEDLLDLGRILQVLPVRPLEDLDVLRLEGLGREHVGEVVGVDDLGDRSFFFLWFLDLRIGVLHLLVLRLLLDDLWSSADNLRLLLPEVLVSPEDRDVLHLVLELGLLVLRRGLDVLPQMELARLGLRHFLRARVRLGLVELVVGVNLDLRRRLLRSARLADAVLRLVVDEIVHLIVTVASGIVLGVDLAVVAVGLLLEQVLEDGLHVRRRARARASVHLAGLLEMAEGVLAVGPFKDRHFRIPPIVLLLVFVLVEVLHSLIFIIIIDAPAAPHL